MPKSGEVAERYRLPARRYRSEVRQAQAAATRSRVLDAATGLFSTRGYGRVTMQAVADQAGVSVETVYAQGTKSSLLRCCVDRALAGNDEPVALASQPASVEALGAATQVEVATAFARLSVTRAQRAAAAIVAFEDAAAADPALAEEWQLAEQRRLVDYRGVVDALARVGGLAPGYDAASATEALWATLTPRLAHVLLDRLGWHPDRVVAWVVGTVRTVLAENERGET